MPYALVGFSEWRWEFHNIQWRLIGEQASHFSALLSFLALSLIGGNLIASERSDRSAEFQAYLPISRRRLWFGKLCLPFAIAVATWLLNTVTQCYCKDGPLLDHSVLDRDRLFEIVGIPLFGLTFFSCAWLLSAVLKSPTIAIFGGMTIALLTLAGIAFVTGHLSISNQSRFDSFLFWMPVALITESLSCFTLGSWIFLRRVEP
jgi:ABC-type transport system involved in multi-copper enzyme maturation permease subunit